ncbi:MAG: hypothetical protein COB88_02430 [Flavobacteriales bacterium]|nr:MAG: hypothetical protein COB88_02430 [Flavobacteriales bacterium]
MVKPRLIAIGVALVISQWGAAQSFDISVKMGVPLPNSLHWDDIWNVSIDNNIATSTMPTTVDIRVVLELNGVVYEAVTKKFLASLGPTYFNASIAKTKNLTVLTENLKDKALFIQHNEMRDGTYQLCVTLNLYNPLGAVLYTTSDCIFHEVSHPGMIILNTPIDGDTVLSELLQFSWTHVTERNSDFQSYYVLDLATILPDQSPKTAIAVNPKRLSIDQLTEPYLDYPQIERPLDTGEVYAWRVIAYTSTRSTSTNEFGQNIFGSSDGKQQEIARSNVGYFVCGVQKNPSQPQLRKQKSTYFIDLVNGSLNQIYFFNMDLPISLKNPYAHRDLSCKIYNSKRELIEMDLPNISMKPGVNAIHIDLSSGNLTPEQFYFAELQLSDALSYWIKLYKQKVE